MDQGHGKIVNISSVAGKRVNPGSTVYSATKYAVDAISQGTRMESAGGSATCIFPAPVTELAKSVKDEAVIEMFMKRDWQNCSTR